jgi:SAM-dependent methyltransferase
MFERIPEPELMQDYAQCMNYHIMHTAEPEIITKWLEVYHETVNITKGTIVDLGCGTANLIIALLNLHPELTAVCYDGSEAMCKIARQNIRGHELEDRITVIHDDLYTATGAYDLAMSTRALHHVNDTEGFWELITALAPNFMVCDLERPDSEDLIPSDMGIDIQNSLRAAYTVSEIREQVADITCEVARTSIGPVFYGVTVYRTV